MPCSIFPAARVSPQTAWRFACPRARGLRLYENEAVSFVELHIRRRDILAPGSADSALPPRSPSTPLCGPYEIAARSLSNSYAALLTLSARVEGSALAAPEAHCPDVRTTSMARLTIINRTFNAALPVLVIAVLMAAVVTLRAAIWLPAVIN